MSRHRFVAIRASRSRLARLRRGGGTERRVARKFLIFALCTAGAHVIRIATAPVFLLAGSGLLLSVLTGRPGRIIDRARVLEAARPTASESKRRADADELSFLARRSVLIHWAIILATGAELLVRAVVAALFFGVFFGIDVSMAVGWTFIAAMLALIVSLSAFLREVHLATRTIRAGCLSRDS